MLHLSYGIEPRLLQSDILMENVPIHNQAFSSYEVNSFIHSFINYTQSIWAAPILVSTSVIGSIV